VISTAVLVALLVLILVILVGNTMIAVAFLKGRRGDFKGMRGRDEEARDELHRRVEKITGKKG
jgi:hypothetical protein